jgi:hypothetical protein
VTFWHVRPNGEVFSTMGEFVPFGRHLSRTGIEANFPTRAEADEVAATIRRIRDGGES